ncbi:glutathione S-transferase family protein [Paraferrimonas sp. SM1919]|uniref:glutathione S-transferase family protein n=1 Tax=Paraferrimonas sp. SM1919 TaxID=2662263 RepID=UPI0013D8484E|nr:glutathione S-transferase family protein [Paraferrimonas sp. SM1919]
MDADYKLYGWQISLFTGKVRAYLNYKGLNYVQKPMSLFDIKRFEKKHNFAAMPVIETKQGQTLTDTSLIIEELERRHPKHSLSLDCPLQQTVSNLLEVWFDEIGHVIALHTRWNFPENYPSFRKEGGDSLLPYAPRFIKNLVVDKVAAARMRAAMVRMGAVGEQIPLLERWINQLLDLLEAHFSAHDYLLGGQPSVADYSLIGLCYAHLYLDRWPRRELIDPRPNLKAYIERVHSGQKQVNPPLSQGQIPNTLLPLLNMFQSEFVPLLESMQQSVQGYIAKEGKQAGDTIPRLLEEITFPMLDGHYKRLVFTYTFWMLQRSQKQFRTLDAIAQQHINEWFMAHKLTPILEISSGPAVTHNGLTVKLAG